jgi:putative ABC transport system permease protein
MSITIIIAFAVTMALGVTYNSARIALSERARELATLRIVGFRTSEIAGVMLGEHAVLSAVAIPFGLVLGYVLYGLIALTYRTELYRIPIVVTASANALASCILALAVAVSSGLIYRLLTRLDLIAVLKAE